MRIVELRAHHLLCILGFRGLGYSKSFTKNMEKIIKDIHGGLYHYIKIVDGYDIICSVCPYRKNNECHREENSEKRVKNRDLEVIKRLKIKIGDQFSPNELWPLLVRRISSPDIPVICHDCEWLDLGYCIKGLLNLKQKIESSNSYA